MFKCLTYHLLIIISSLLTCLNANAQFMPVPSTMSTPYGNIHTTNYVYTPMFHRYGGTARTEGSFNVTFLDSTQKIVKGIICIDSPSCYLKWTDKSVDKKDSGRIKKIYPSQTISLGIAGTYGSIVGKNADSCWLFKSVKGRINVYTALPWDPDVLTDAMILYIQKEDGPLLQMNETNLGELLKDNEKAYGFFKKKKYLKAINKYNNPF